VKFELSWEKVHSLFDSGFAFPRHKLNRNDLDETIYWNLRPFAATFLLPRDAMHVLAMGLCLSVPLSVCLSVTSRSSTKTAKRRITKTTQHDSPVRDSSFLTAKISAKFDRGHPLRGRQMQVGRVKIGDY